MKNLTEAWMQAAADDLAVIERIVGDAGLSHIVAFHAQQAIEKVFKALLEESAGATAKSHNLVTLHALVNQHIPLSVDLSMLQTLNSLYVDARYPGSFGLLPNGKPTVDDARKFQEHAQKLYGMAYKTLG